MDRRAQLVGWIAATERTRRRLVWLSAGLAAISLALALWRPAVGELGLLIVAIVAFSGWWVTSGHLAEWRGKLADLDAAAKRSPTERA